MMRECYEIIKDETALRQFIDWLPDHSNEECYFYALFYRAKYSQENRISGGGNLLFRGISDKKSLFRKFQQLECPLGAYEKRGEPIAQESLALYINPNFRNLYKASLNTLSQLAENIKKDHRTAAPHKEALSCIQTSAGEKTYLDFDIDTKDPEILKRAIKILDPVIPEIIETRGGYHVLVKRSMIERIKENKTWHKQLQEISDVSGDCLLPVVGSYCGGFCPRFVNPNDFT